MNRPIANPIWSWCSARRRNCPLPWSGSWRTPSWRSYAWRGVIWPSRIWPLRSPTSRTGAAGLAGSTTMSELYRDVGVVLRTYKLRESDRIIVFMTEENGKVRAVAKGVRKTKSKFGARLEPMSHVRLLLYRGRELDIVSQADSVESLSPLWSSLDRASQAMAALEAVDQLGLEREPNPRLYRMAVGVLRTIAERPAALNVPAFYWKLLAAEGLEPQLDACVRCGESEPERAARLVRPQRGWRDVPELPVGYPDFRVGAGNHARHPRRPPERIARPGRITRYPRSRSARDASPRTPHRAPPQSGRHVRTPLSCELCQAQLPTQLPTRWALPEWSDVRRDSRQGQRHCSQV